VRGALWAAWLVSTLCVSARAASACQPAASVVGDDDALVVEVRALLALRGVVEAQEEGCPWVVARLAASPAGLEVIVKDSFGRGETKVVSDAVIAATIIESWTRADLEDPLLVGHEPPPPKPAPVAANKAPASAPYDYDDPGAAARLMLFTSQGADGSLWLDPELSGCVRLGAWCVGGALRGRFDLRQGGDSEPLDTSRVGVDVSALVERPVRLGELALIPGVGVGAGWLRSSFVGEEAGGRPIDVDSAGLRLEARLGLAYELDDDVSVELMVRFASSPVAHTTSYLDEGFEVAGEPAWLFGLGLGLRYGEP
jgi:hypothetical protein